MADRVVLTIGTRKGVFVAGAAKTRRRFDLRGPFGDGVHRRLHAEAQHQLDAPFMAGGARLVYRRRRFATSPRPSARRPLDAATPARTARG
jgi:hypothetical protein